MAEALALVPSEKPQTQVGTRPLPRQALSDQNVLVGVSLTSILIPVAVALIGKVGYISSCFRPNQIPLVPKLSTFLMRPIWVGVRVGWATESYGGISMIICFLCQRDHLGQLS